MCTVTVCFSLRKRVQQCIKINVLIHSVICTNNYSALTFSARLRSATNSKLVWVKGSEGTGTSASIALYISVMLFWPCKRDGYMV